jgi:diguanylate cyclase (GGDEF)-like protein
VTLPDGWATQQLAEFLAAISSPADACGAARTGVERAAEALEADAAALVAADGEIQSSVGFPAGAVPAEEIVAVAAGIRRTLTLAGAGECATLSAPLEDGDGGRLVLVRAVDSAFSREESALARGMARVLALTLRSLRVLDRERGLREESERHAAENERLLHDLTERQALLERLSDIQRSIVRRADRQSVLDAIVAAATALIGDDFAMLRLIDRDSPSTTTVAAASGLDAALIAAVDHTPLTIGTAGRAMLDDHLHIIDDYAASEHAQPALREAGLTAAIAAPVHREGGVVGSIVVGSRVPGRKFDAREREILLSLAEHASLALTDAALVDEAFHRAFHDALTGLPNRALFANRLDHALAVSERSGVPVSVLFLDLDGFKTVNDSLGHAMGDRLLVGVAERLAGCMRAGDTVARFGGDEFAFLVEAAGAEADAPAAAQRILASLREPIDIGGRMVTVTASVGIASGTSRADDVLRNADVAMYRAKAGGKGRYESFEPQMHVDLLERLEIEQDLSQALERNEFILHYQPVVELDSGDIVAVEALVRWQHPERGLVPPLSFIPLAEETGLIVPLGRWVLNEACRQAVRWRNSHGPVTITVNLSGVQLEQPGLVDEVAEALRESGLEPERLVLEITETVLMHDDKATIDMLHRLKGLGVRLAVDDFGTGYSSLQYLRGFPLDILKVAKSFVDGLDGTGDDGTALARAIIDLGGSFELDVVGEGIELAVQRDALVELGCRLGQGFLFARPGDAATIAAQLQPPRLPSPPAGDELDGWNPSTSAPTH